MRAAMAVILPAVLPVFIVALIGYALAKAGRPFDSKTVAFLVAGIGTPALVFFNLAKTPMVPDVLFWLAAATTVAILLYLVVGAAALKASGLKLRTYLPSLAFPNAGNLGLPLALYAGGEQGLNYAIIVFAVTSIFNLTAGQAIAAGRGQWIMVARSPIIPTVIAGLAFSYSGAVLQVWAANTLSLLSSLTIPLMLLMLGTSLARIELTALPRSVALGSLRLGMGIAAGFALSALFGFAGAMRIAFVIQCAMPVAVYNYLFAQMYDNAPEDVASLVVVSTLLSVITTPILLAVLV
jgi:malate permease and related proteins